MSMFAQSFPVYTKSPVRLAILPTLMALCTTVACANPPPNAGTYQNDQSIRYFNDAERTLGRGYVKGKCKMVCLRCILLIGR